MVTKPGSPDGRPRLGPRAALFAMGLWQACSPAGETPLPPAHADSIAVGNAEVASIDSLSPDSVEATALSESSEVVVSVDGDTWTGSAPDADLRNNDAAGMDIDVAFDAGDVEPPVDTPPPDVTPDIDGKAPLDAVLDVAPPLPGTVTAPLDCPNLPALCPILERHGGLPLAKVSGSDYPAWNDYRKANQGTLGWLKLADDSLYSRWAPLQWTVLGPQTVRLHASWFNQAWLPKGQGTGPGSDYTVAMDGVQGCYLLKASLLPSGCVTVDIDTATGLATGYDFQAASPTMMMASKTHLDGWPAPACAGVNKPAATGALSVTMADGTVVTARPGRASMHLLRTDASADPSPLVRDLPAGATASVVELALPVPLAGQPTQVALDVTVCRATADELQKSGCACPTEPWPPADVTPTTGDYLRVQVGDSVRMITGKFLDSVEPTGWSGVGVAKWFHYLPTNEWLVVGHGSSCCNNALCPGPPVADWRCAGSLGNDWSSAVAAEARLYRGNWLSLLLTKLQPCKGPGLPCKTSFQTNVDGFDYFRDGLAGRALPARQRDGYADLAMKILMSGSDAPYGVGTFELKAWSPTHSEFRITHVVRLCRRHFGEAAKSFFALPPDMESVCKQPVPLHIDGRLYRWQP